MKKLLLTVSVVLTLGLAGCIPSNLIEDPVSSLTEEEIKDLIEDYVPEVQNEVTTTYDLSSFEDAITNMVANSRNGVLGVINISSEGSSTGSGVVYKKEGSTTYYLVTNEHVVNGHESLSIVYERNGLLFEITNEFIEFLGSDVTTDLAVLKFDSTQDFSVIPLGNSYDIKLGQFVFAIGNPLGFEYYGTVTMGIISGLARYQVDDEFNATLLQHDAAISPGNSGGALLNTNGELIGINNMKIVSSDVSNIGFAIPSNTVNRITTDLEDDGIITRPYLGIVTSANVNTCGLDYGVCIEVQEGGAAENAGLQDGDTIIGFKNEFTTEFLEILNFNDLKEAILNSSVGETVVIRYIRAGVEYDSVPTELNVHPDDQ